ncbi:hypothetical protein HO133_007028 [Letharia lupina]|uniref:UNC-45/Cro1/She4 central domain-containing protein n=1 Tax=Letharia lupina TaxID=560253 RepID=A0A8H6CU84_9LECA|nr:uncharacterized protein HO133_007028 [Letharia lupina]KAF6228916.1 hypothetical protein HO133_007028 [Letharia lupina]
MADEEREARAAALASQALELVASGRDEDGSRALQEAASLAPSNPHVKAAFDKIRSDDLQHRLQKLCSEFILEHDEGAGKEALSYLNRSAEVPGDVAKACLELVVRPEIYKDGEVQDGIVAGLLREAPAAKIALAKKLHDDTTMVAFEKIFRLGDGSSNGMTDVVLDPAAWSTESIREECEKDVFQLYLAKLIQVGDEENFRALKGIARLLAADTERLRTLIDEETFDVVLSSLDNRNTVEVRSQATLVTAKYLEASGDNGQKTLTQFVSSRLTRQRNEDLVQAFSAAAGVFPVASSPASTLFLTEGFVQALVPLLKKKAKSEKVELAALDMLSAACIDSACREAIKKHCTTWLQHILATGKDERPGLAAVILAKIQGPSSQGTSSKVQMAAEEKSVADDLVPRLKSMMVEDPLDSNQSSIEGLAYASVQPKIKEELARDDEFLKKLLRNLRHSPPGSPTSFGGLALIDNLTRYLPNLSEEQRRMAQLKAYANASKNAPQADPLDEDAAVTERCKAIVNAGAISVLVGMRKNLSPNSMNIVIRILLSLSRTSSLRGIIAQQGGVRLLLQGYTLIIGSSDSDMEVRRTAAHALARILISIDPSLVFPSSGSMPLTSVIRPILSLLREDSGPMTQGPRDLLPTFEALIALANLATVPSSGAAESIIRQAYPTIEDLLLSNNTLVQRAATQLVCNLANCPLGVELFADESPAAARRMHILLAMADVEDVATRCAAAGALAVVTEFEGAVKAILARNRAMEIILALADDESGDRGIVHRACVCVMNAVCQESDTGKKAKNKVKELAGVETLNDLMIDYKDDDPITQCVRQALQALMK